MLDMIKSGIVGLAAGDALGVPVEFMSRKEIAAQPVRDMRGWGTYMQPPGTWSDDTGMVLATMDSLSGGFDPEDVMQKFVTWSHGESYWPYDEVFDMGATTNKAIGRYKSGVPALACGCSGERDNGNGALMRILPAAMYLFPKTGIKMCRDEQSMRFVHDLCRLTHAHPRSMIACGMYVSIASHLLAQMDLFTAINVGVMEAAGYYLSQPYAQELNHFTRLADVAVFARVPKEVIRSSGYVVDTLEAAIWCLLNSRSYEECVLKAVNLGEDTDTVAAVAGGLAGIAYGVEDIPARWLLQMPKRGYMDELCDRFYVNVYGEGK